MVLVVSKKAAKPGTCRSDILLMVLIVLLLGIACGGSSSAEPTQTPQPTTTPTMTPTTEPEAQCGDEQFTVSKVLPSTVMVLGSEGSGSGVLVDGPKILTANHVVEGQASVTVRLNDGRTFTATVRDGDPISDIAILDIDTDWPLPVVEWADREPEQGAKVVALGYPFSDLLGEAEEPTVTSGIVSRRFDEESVRYVQTDAAINPGNSGGPLVDLCGKLVGINVAKLFLAEGIGLAVSIETARPVATWMATAAPREPAGREVAPDRGLDYELATIRDLGYTATGTSTYRPGGELHVLIGIETGSGDGYIKHGFFFVGGEYLGLDFLDPSAGVSLAWDTGDTVALRYVLYNPQDPLCCPTAGAAIVRFYWDGQRLSPLDPIPPVDWNVPGSRR